MTIIPALDPVRPFSAVIVPPGKKRDRHQVVWTDAWENATWFALSTEASLAYHYWINPELQPRRPGDGAISPNRYRPTIQGPGGRDGGAYIDLAFPRGFHS